VGTYGQRAPFSNIGQHISLVAPGVDIISTYPGGGTAMLSGTSVSAAFVSGSAARIAVQPQFDTPDKVRAALQDSAFDLGDPGRDIYHGFGLVQTEAALVHNLEDTPTPVPWAQVDGTPDAAVQAMAIETLWGVATPSAPTCSVGPITNSANSTDQLFNDTAGSCASFTKNETWTYPSIQDTTLTTINTGYAFGCIDLRDFHLSCHDTTRYPNED
jgi:hypothetical protein